MRSSFFSRLFIVLLVLSTVACSSVKELGGSKSDYSEDDIRQNEINTIVELKEKEPVKALWRSVLLGDEKIKNECIKTCEEEFGKLITQEKYFEANRYAVSLVAAGEKEAAEYKKHFDKYYDDIPGLSSKNEKIPKSIADCVNATVTIWVDKGLKLQNGSGFADIIVGSGFFIDKRGYLITNHHVISDLVDPEYEGFSRLYIKLLSDTDTKIPAKVVGYDPILDLALLKTEIEPEFVLSLGDSTELSVGDKVSAIGAPIGLDGTLTSGIISSTDRKLLTLGNYFQVDAAVNSGNSGGPLIGENRKVQGVVFAGMLTYQGLNFAIPVEYLRTLLPALYEGEEVVHGWIGAYGHTMRRGNKKIGLEVQHVMSGSVAQLAGLKTNDIITKINGVAVNTIEDFQCQCMNYSVGTMLGCEYIRDDEKFTTVIYLEKRPENPLIPVYESDYLGDVFVPAFGMKLIPTSSSRRKSFIVQSVIKGTSADELGFSENDVLTITGSKLDKKRKLYSVQVYTKRRKKGFMDISIVLATALDNPYYF